MGKLTAAAVLAMASAKGLSVTVGKPAQLPPARTTRPAKPAAGPANRLAPGGAFWMLSLFVPGLKVSSRLNARECWGEVHKRNRHEDDAIVCGLAGMGWDLARVPRPEAVRFTRVYGPAGKPYDEGDNLPSSMKAARDTFARLLNIDDGPGGVRWLYRQEQGECDGVLIDLMYGEG